MLFLARACGAQVSRLYLSGTLETSAVSRGRSFESFSSFLSFLYVFTFAAEAERVLRLSENPCISQHVKLYLEGMFVPALAFRNGRPFLGEFSVMIHNSLPED